MFFRFSWQASCRDGLLYLAPLAMVLIVTTPLRADNPSSPPAPQAEAIPPLPKPILDSFTRDILPIFQTHCLDCHDSETKTSELDLSTLPGLLHGAASGEIVVPGKADESLLMHLLRPKSEPHMPPDDQLPEADIAAIRRWVDSLPKSLSTGPAKQKSTHWSFLPRTSPTPPVVSDPALKAWSRGPIDQFIAAKLQSQELRPNPPADKLTLIRRMTFDLTGLPPTKEEVEAYLRDDSKEATEKLVDRLLASPRYGERWGRHWLDLARYADSDGFEVDNDRPTAFRYRDYVIRAFNDDKPYSQFVKEQLAGDEIPGATSEERTATGFCRNGPTIDNQANEKNRLDEMDDVVSTTSLVFLGLSVGCARCHDHKFDPITQREYYQMLAIFNSIDKKDHDVASPQERAEYRRSLDAFNAQRRPLEQKLERLTPIPEQYRGQWKIEGEELVQTSEKKDVRLFFGEPNWTNYVFEAEAKRTAGKEGFLLAFRAADLKNSYWVNFGGRDNPKHGVETEINGKRQMAIALKPGQLENDRWYRIRIVVEGTRFRCYLDDELVYDFMDNSHVAGGVGLGSWMTQNRWRNIRVTSLDNNQVLFAGLPETERGKAKTPAEEKQLAAERKRIKNELAKLDKTRPQPATALGIAERNQPRTTHLLYRGDLNNQGPVVEPGVPAVLLSAKEATDAESAFVLAKSETADKSGPRTALAEWIIRADNPLTARVMANRVWSYHFGRGLVSTPSDFGKTGAAPSHPELLDWLADRYVEFGWQLKPLHKEILLSATYQQASTYHADFAAKDPSDVWLWRFPIRRIEAEAIRDSILQASGNLNLAMFGPGVRPRIHPGVIASGSSPKWPIIKEETPEMWRRSVYVFTKRSVMMPFLEGFDFPTTSASCERRMATTIPTQALQLMNGAFTNDQAIDMATAILKAEGSSPDHLNDWVRAAYWRAFSRAPSDNEIQQATSFLRDRESVYRKQAMEGSQSKGEANNGTADSETLWSKSLADFCHVLFNASEFVYVN